MTTPPLTLRWLDGTYAVCRLSPAAPEPAWARAPASLVVIARTTDELSIVAPDDAVPETIDAQRGFAAFRVVGTLDFALVGILAQLTVALADASVPVFAVSTFDTDYLLIPVDRRDEASRALARIAHFTHDES